MGTYVLDMHRLGLQITVQAISTQLPALAALLDATKGRIELREIRRVDGHAT